MMPCLLKTPALYCHLGLLVARLLSWMEPSIRVLTRECPRTPDENRQHFCRWHQKKVAKSVQCGEPSLVKVVGICFRRPFLLAGWIGSGSAIFGNAILV